MLTIAALQVFDQAYLLFWRDQTNASPDSSLFYGVYLFQQAFRQFDFGLAAAMAWLLFVIIMIITARPGAGSATGSSTTRETADVGRPSRHRRRCPIQAQPAGDGAVDGRSDCATRRSVGPPTQPWR